MAAGSRHTTDREPGGSSGGRDERAVRDAVRAAALQSEVDRQRERAGEREATVERLRAALSEREQQIRRLEATVEYREAELSEARARFERRRESYRSYIAALEGETDAADSGDGDEGVLSRAVERVRTSVR